MQNQLDILEKIKKGLIDIAELSKKSGVPAGKMYKWKARQVDDIPFKDALKLLSLEGLAIRPIEAINSDRLGQDPPSDFQHILLMQEELLQIVKRIEENTVGVLPSVLGKKRVLEVGRYNKNKKDKSGKHD